MIKVITVNKQDLVGENRTTTLHSINKDLTGFKFITAIESETEISFVFAMK